jgi:hypothetical protein
MLAKYYKVESSAVSDMISDGLVTYEDFMKASSGVLSNVAKTANDTFTGALSNFRSALANAFMPVATPFLTNIRERLVKLIPLVKEGITPYIKKAMTGLTPRINEFGEKLDEVITNGMSAFKIFFTQVSAGNNIFDALKSSVRATFGRSDLFDSFISSLKTAFQFGGWLKDRLAEVFRVLMPILPSAMELFLTFKLLNTVSFGLLQTGLRAVGSLVVKLATTTVPALVTAIGGIGAAFPVVAVAAGVAVAAIGIHLLSEQTRVNTVTEKWKALNEQRQQSDGVAESLAEAELNAREARLAWSNAYDSASKLKLEYAKIKDKNSETAQDMKAQIEQADISRERALMGMQKADEAVANLKAELQGLREEEKALVDSTSADLDKYANQMVDQINAIGPTRAITSLMADSDQWENAGKYIFTALANGQNVGFEDYEIKTAELSGKLNNVYKAIIEKITNNDNYSDTNSKLERGIKSLAGQWVKYTDIEFKAKGKTSGELLVTSTKDAIWKKAKLEASAVSTNFVDGLVWEIPQKVQDKGKVIGENLVTGFKLGLYVNSDYVKEQAQKVADNLTNPIKYKLGINSPSKVFMKIGSYVTAGLGLGLQKGTDFVEKSLNSATASLTSYAPGLAGSGFIGNQLAYPSQVTLVDSNGSLLGLMDSKLNYNNFNLGLA